MQQQQPPPGGILQDIRGFFSIGSFVMDAAAKPAEAILLRSDGTMGDKYFAGLAGVLPVPVLVVWSGLVGEPLLLYTAGLYLLVVFLHAVKRRKLRKQGRWEHSLYMGESRLRWLPGGDLAAKQWYEPFLCVGLGVLFLGYYPAYAPFWLASGLALMGNYATLAARDAAEDRALNDSRIRQQVSMGRYRERVGERDE